MKARDGLLFRAGEERGIARAMLARAHSTTPKSASRKTFVRLARQAGQESVRYLRAARGES
jgi:hypothetical protein